VFLLDQTKAVLTKEELKLLRTECMGLSEILIPGCDVKLTMLIAEGTVSLSIFLYV